MPNETQPAADAAPTQPAADAAPTQPAADAAPASPPAVIVSPAPAAFSDNLPGTPAPGSFSADQRAVWDADASIPKCAVKGCHFPMVKRSPAIVVDPVTLDAAKPDLVCLFDPSHPQN